MNSISNTDVYKVSTFSDLVEGNSYVGRGIVIGKSEDGKKACVAYFIMGRSANSRNRVFVERDGAVYTEPFDPRKVEDPSLIIYAALRRYQNKLIVTNGDQTDTIYQGLCEGKSFSEALASRAFEPDAPNLTPRISGMLTFSDNDFTYEMSILKSVDKEGSACARYTFSYPALCGVGHFIHTYNCNGDPLPTFLGEPKRVVIPNSIDDFASSVWSSLDKENRISLYVCYIDLQSKQSECRIINGNG